MVDSLHLSSRMSRSWAAALPRADMTGPTRFSNPVLLAKLE